MGMGVHRIIKKMENFDLENQAKTITLKKWPIVTPN
jgi:hypothetical protein